MGTNFYLAGHADDDVDEPEYHVGKRSAAGLYCWDCDATLCVGGKARVHYGRGLLGEWLNSCPSCGQVPADESLEESAAGRELGFNTSRPTRLKGVRSCASFTWAMPPERFSGLVGEGQKFEDEYGQSLSADEMMEVIKACPIQFEDSIGMNFS